MPLPKNSLLSLIFLSVCLLFCSFSSASLAQQSPEENEDTDVFGAWFEEARQERENEELSRERLARTHRFIPIEQHELPPLGGTIKSSAFFARDPWHFGLPTLLAVQKDFTVWLGQTQREFSSSPMSVVKQFFLPVFSTIFLFFLLTIYHKKADNFFIKIEILSDAEKNTELTRNQKRQQLAKQLLFRIIGSTITPIILWGMSYFLLTGVSNNAHWAAIFNYIIGLIVLYHLVMTLLREFLSGKFFTIDHIVAEKLISLSKNTGIYVFILFSILFSLDEYQYREDLQAMLGFFLRLLLTFTSIRLFLLRKELFSLFPEEGIGFYKRFHNIMNRHLSRIFAAPILLLILWSAGFSQAASTILSRGYGLIGILILAAFVFRWINSHSVSELQGTESLIERVVDQTEHLLRIILFAITISAAISMLGMHRFFNMLLHFPLYKTSEVALSGQNLLFGASIFILALFIARTGRVVGDELLRRAFPDDPGIVYAGATTGYYVFLLLAGLATLLIMGFDFSTLAVFAASLGVGIGLALQDIARNFVSGLILLFGRRVAKDDFVTVSGELYGKVMSIGVRSVTVRSGDNLEYVVPANDLVNSTVINWSHSDRYVRLKIPIGVSYDSNVDQVRSALIEAALDFPVVREGKRAPDVWLTEFADNSVNLTLLIWIDLRATDRLEVEGKILFRIWEIFHKHNIEIPFPQRDLHIRSAFGEKAIESLSSFLNDFSAQKTSQNKIKIQK